MDFKTIEKEVSTQIVEKKSKFIAKMFCVNSINEVDEILKATRKQYYDARHVCYAYRIINNNEITEKSSDDGEPSGTAGAPILNLLVKNEINNVLVLVIRYFGGILLGTGGLVKAYTEAVQEAMKEVHYRNMTEGYEMSVNINYSDIEKFKYFCEKNDITIVSEKYLENVSIIIEVSEKDKQKILQNSSNLSFLLLDFAILDKKMIFKTSTETREMGII